MPKRKNATRSDGRIAVQIYLGIGEDGKRKVKTVYGKTQKEVNEKAAELRAQLGRGLDISKMKDSFKDWSKLFLSVQKKKITDSEYNTKSKRIEYFYDYIGDFQLNAVKVFQIESALIDLAKKNPFTGKPTADKTLRAYRQSCSQVFAFAIKNRAIEFNPADLAEIPKNAPKNERRALTETERKWIQNLSDDNRAKCPAMVAMFCGLRRGELSALTWNDVDLYNKILTVNKSYDFKSKNIKSPKTAAGVRKIPIPDVLVEYLKSVPRKSIYVCRSAKNKMITDMGWKRLLDSLMLDLEMQNGNREGKKKKKCAPGVTAFTIQKFGWHDLRHTYATILFEAGVDVLTAQYLLGHASAETTMKIYTHLSDAQKERSIVKLNEFVSGNDAFKSNSSQTG